jgi:uncharacterized protein
MQQTLSFELEVKALSDRQFEGHGAIFGNVDLGGDVILPGAFKSSLAAHRKAGSLPAMFWMHKMDQVAGAWTEMKEDSKGLHVRGELADTTLGNEVRTLLKMKAVRGLSIGYRVMDFDFNKDGVRVLKELDVHEVSIVSLAMNPMAKVEAVKARLSDLGEYVPTEREFERTLRDAGLSRSVARMVCAKMFDDEPTSGMLERTRQWDAGKVDSEEEKQMKELLEALNGHQANLEYAARSQ